jgi:hypothetical protein
MKQHKLKLKKIQIFNKFKLDQWIKLKRKKKVTNSNKNHKNIRKSKENLKPINKSESRM